MNIKDYEISVKPYNGRLFVSGNTELYGELFKHFNETPDVLESNIGGQVAIGCGSDGMWMYLVYASDTANLVHELTHAALHIFERCGINPASSEGEAFCYFLGYLFEESMSNLKFKTN